MLWEVIHNCSCCVHFLCQQIHFLNFKGFLWKTPCWPLLAPSAESSFCIQPFISGPLTFPTGESPQPVSNQLCLMFLFPEGSCQLQIPGEGLQNSPSPCITSLNPFIPLYRTASGDSPTKPVNELPLFLTVFMSTYIQPHPFSLLSSTVLGVCWSHSLQDRIRPSHVTDTLTCLAWNKIHHLMHHFASTCGW